MMMMKKKTFIFDWNSKLTIQSVKSAEEEEEKKIDTNI